MKQRNKWYAGASIAVAALAVGGGAMVSASAMADSGAPGITSKLTMINVGADGKPVQCTFDGADAAAIIGTSPPPGLPKAGDLPGMVTVQAGVVSGSGVVGSGVVGQGQLTLVGVAPITDQAGGIPAPGSAEVPGAPIIVNTESARQGTAAECAAMKDAAPTVSGLGSTVIATSGSALASADTVKP